MLMPGVVIIMSAAPIGPDGKGTMNIREEKMSVYRHVIISAFILAALAAQASAETANGNINLVVGSRQLTDSGWTGRGTTQNYTLGIDFDYARPDWPMNLYVGLAGFRDNSKSVNLDTNLNVQEICLGARMYLGHMGFIRPYLSGGADIMNVSLDSTVDLNATNSTASTLGYFLNAGVALNFFGFLNVGVDARWIGGTHTTNKVSAMDYYQASLVLGVSL